MYFPKYETNICLKLFVQCNIFSSILLLNISKCVQGKSQKMASLSQSFKAKTTDKAYNISVVSI